jgi:hypothetical protein
MIPFAHEQSTCRFPGDCRYGSNRSTSSKMIAASFSFVTPDLLIIAVALVVIILIAKRFLG